MKTIGLIGSGRIGQAVAKLAIGSGYQVVMSNSRGPETLAELVEQLGPKASAASAAEAAFDGDLVVVTIPFKNYLEVPVEPLDGKIVIDTNNYYPARDGGYSQLENDSTTSSEMLQAHLANSQVVKAFNNIESSQLAADGLPARSPGRRALPIAGDSSEAKNTVGSLIEGFGYDVVDVGTLADGWRFQRDTVAYGPRFSTAELMEALTRAERYSQP